MWKRIAVVILLLALGFSYYQEHQAVAALQRYYPQLLPEAHRFEALTPTTAIALDEFDQALGYVGVAQEVGYGGPVVVGLVVDMEGRLQQPILLESRETPNYIEDMRKAGFFNQFAKKTVTDTFVYQKDIQGITGATLSTRAITTATGQITQAIGVAKFDYLPAEAADGLQVGVKEIIVAILFAGGIVCGLRFPSKRLRLVFLGLSVIILGFWLNRSVAMSQISSAFLGYYPQIDTNLLWYLVLAGILLPPLLAGKNLYCGWFCPFCGLQEGIHLVTRQNWAFGSYAASFRFLKNLILFVVLLTAFLLKNPNVSSFEPFGTVFGLSGSALSWVLVGLALIASAIYKRFWCRTLCPVGAILDTITQARNCLVHKLTGQKRVQTQQIPIAPEQQTGKACAVQPATAEVEKKQTAASGPSEKLALLLFFLLAICILILTVSKYMNMMIAG